MRLLNWVWLFVATVTLPACFTTVKVKEPAGAPLPVTEGRFPHEVFGKVLAAHVDARGRVDYRALKADRVDLERYLVAIASTSPHSAPEMFPTKEDKLAYWINAYNAYVLFGVTERPAMKSVNDESKNFFYFTEYEVGGQAVSLYDLENDIVRKEFSEPRIHFALNCASAGCPELPAEPFLPETLEQQLAQESREFCAHPDKVRVNETSGKVEVSQIFEWYREDFEASGGPASFCKKWGRDDLPEVKPELVQFIPYDWTLNAQPGKR